MSRFYVEVLQAVLLLGSETWVLTPCLEKYLEGFNHRAVQRMVGMVPKHKRNETCVYPPIGEALAMVGLEEIRVYIACRHNTVVQYIDTHPIMDLCLSEDWNPGMCLSG